MTEGNLHPEYKPPVGHLREIKQLVQPAGLTPDQKRAELADRLAATAEIQIRTARIHFPAFMEYCFRDEEKDRNIQMQWFHDEWSLAMDSENHMIIVAPRDHGKTTIIVGRVLWELGRNPNLRIKIVCASDGRAKERLYEIVQHIKFNPRLREVFPSLVESDEGEWSKHKIVVNRTARHRDASIEALGITSTATGGRADLLIADDVVDRRNALSMPALRDQIKQAWRSDWSNLLEPNSRVWYICTLWHKDDLSHELMDNAGYRTLFYAVPDNFGSMWPDKWPEEALRSRHGRIGTVEFNRAFRNQAVDEESSLVRPHWFKYSVLRRNKEFTDRLNELTFFTSYDTAVGVKQMNDYFASCTIAVDPKRREIVVVDAWHDHLSIKEQSEVVIAEARRFQPFRVLIEKVGQSTLDEWVINEQPEMAGLIEVTTPRVSKYHRLAAVTPLMEAGQVVFSSHLDPDMSDWSAGRGNLVGELRDFPFGRHDDMVDAFSQALDAARRYFLDVWATGGDNLLEVYVDDQEPEQTKGYLF